ncbi:MAG: pseudouridine synthase [Balneolaceae bacterium]
MSKSTGTRPDIPILYEDNHLLIIIKPVDVLSQQDYTGDPDVLTLCKAYLRNKYNKSGNAFLGLVHRLDRPAGGVMVLAKTSKAASRISEQIRNHTFQKRYQVVVSGRTAPNGVLIHHLQKNSETNFVTVSANRDRSKKAELSYIRKAYNPLKNLSLLQVSLITGRPHQIRVQFSAEGYPLAGDRKYGSRVQDSAGPALFASSVRFAHPVNGQQVEFTSDCPDHKPWNYF